MVIEIASLLSCYGMAKKLDLHADCGLGIDAENSGCFLEYI